jgi:NADPH:quinone reductase
MIVGGTYPHPKGYPIIGGLEVSGRIAALGPGVAGSKDGDRIAAFLEEAGGFADHCLARVERLIQIPTGMGLDVAAAFPIQALTAWHLFHNVRVTKPGDVILLHAIGDSVGLFPTQLAVRAGATVIGTVGTEGKEARALEYGAAKVVNREDEDFVEAVMRFTEGRGVDKVLASTGASILDRSFSVIRKLGHVVSFSEAEGRPFPSLWERLVAKSLACFHLGHADFFSDAWRQSIDAVVSRIMDGSLKVPLEETFPFGKARAMLDRLASRQVAGSSSSPSTRTDRPPMPQINGGRLLADLRRLAEFGAYKSGVHRPTFSPQDIEARRWLAGRFAERGLRRRSTGSATCSAVRACTDLSSCSSHTESQNHAGWLDGSLGVIYGLEVARAFREDARTARSAIDLAS